LILRIVIITLVSLSLFAQPPKDFDETYYLEAVVESVHDGDTFWVSKALLGLNFRSGRLKIRIKGMQAPEIGYRAADSTELAQGIAVRDSLAKYIDKNRIVLQFFRRRGPDGDFKTIKDGFGRPLCNLWYDLNGDGKLDDIRAWLFTLPGVRDW